MADAFLDHSIKITTEIHIIFDSFRYIIHRINSMFPYFTRHFLDLVWNAVLSQRFVSLNFTNNSKRNKCLSLSLIRLFCFYSINSPKYRKKWFSIHTKANQWLSKQDLGTPRGPWRGSKGTSAKTGIIYYHYFHK